MPNDLTNDPSPSPKDGVALLRGALPRLDPLDNSVIKLLEQNPQLAEGMVTSRVVAATHFGDKLVGLVKDPAFDLRTLLKPAVPGQLTGALAQPDGRPATRVQVTIASPFPSGPGPGTCVTGTDGAFTVSVPEQIRTGPATGSLTLAVAGATKTLQVPVELANLTASGSAGTVVLPASSRTR